LRGEGLPPCQPDLKLDDAIGASARFEQLDMTKEEGWAAELCARHLPLAQFSPGVLFSAHRIVCDYGRISP
jgi:hypothetical protein